MKYLIVNTNMGMEEVVTFSDCSDHSFMARDLKVISAGKFKIYPACPPNAPNPQISVTHGSTTLKIERDAKREEEDQILIEFHLMPRY